MNDYRPVGLPEYQEIDGKTRLMQNHQIWEEVYVDEGIEGGKSWKVLENTGRTIWLEVPNQENLNG